jgi:Mrp family chromosome partitioning ATPase
MPAIASTSEEQPIATGRFKPLVSLLKHKGLAVVIFLLVCAIGVPVTEIKGVPVYMARATLLVSSNYIPTLESDKSVEMRGIQQYQMYVKQQERLIEREDVLQEVLKLPEVQKYWPAIPGEAEEQRILRLQQVLQVESKRGNPFIIVSISGSKPAGLDIIINAIVEIYLKKSQEDTLFDSSGRITVLQKIKQDLDKVITQSEKRRTEIAEAIGVTTFKEDSLNPYDQILIESTKALTLARRQRVEAEARLTALTKKQVNGKTLLDTIVEEKVANDAVLTSFKKTLTDRRSELLTQSLGLTPKHPSRLRAEQEIAQIDHDIEKATQELYREIYQRLINTNEAEIQQAQRVEIALADEQEKQRDQAKQYVTLYNEALTLNREIDRTYQQLNRVNDRIDFLTIEATAPGFVRLDTPAEKPLFPISGGRKKIALIFLVVAFGLAITIPIFVDLLDGRLRTPGEVHKILGFPPLAWILDRRNRRAQQLAKDSLRRMALALERDWHSHDTDCFVLTAVKPGGGTTTLTLELAHILNDLGVRTLAVELNAFKPDSRFGDENLEPVRGLTTLLSQDDFQSLPPEMLIIAADEYFPDRLPVGETAERHLATHGKLRPLFKYLSNYYDLILIDTPPILLSADAELLGKVAGGVILVIEAGVVTPGELKRANHLLERLNPPVVGAILNRVEIYKGGGYFDQLLNEYETGKKKRRGWLQRLLWK